VLAPAGSGLVDVTVTTLGGTSITSTQDQYTYTTPFHILTASLPDATRGVSYSAHLYATGGVQPYRWKKLTKLPRGLKLNRYGMIYGIAKVHRNLPGSYQITVSVTEHTNPKETISTTLTLILH